MIFEKPMSGLITGNEYLNKKKNVRPTKFKFGSIDSIRLIKFPIFSILLCAKNSVKCIPVFTHCYSGVISLFFLNNFKMTVILLVELSLLSQSKFEVRPEENF